MNGWLDEWLDEWMDGWMDGWMDDWMDEWMIGLYCVVNRFCYSVFMLTFFSLFVLDELL